MNTYPRLRKCLVVGIILLFVGMIIIPSTAQNRVKPFLPTANGWMKTFGGTDNDFGTSVHQTTDGGYIITGVTAYNYSTGRSDVWLIKTDGTGDMVWNKSFGGTDCNYGSSVQQTADGGYIITGSTYGYYFDYSNAVLIKTDSNGNKIWNRTFNEGWGYSAQQTTDGGYIITGYHDDDVWLIKTDSNGDKVWDRTFWYTLDYSCSEWGNSVQQTTDGGYIITGIILSSDPFNEINDIWLIKTDSNGRKEWDKTFGGPIWIDEGLSVQQTTDRGYIIVGYTYSRGAGDDDVWLIKTDSNGNKIWDKIFGRKTYRTTNSDGGRSVQQTTDGGYIIAGYSEDIFGLRNDVWLIKTDNNGDMMWSRTFGGTGLDEGFSVQQTTDGGYIIAGFTSTVDTFEYDVLLIKTDSQGKSKTLSSGNLWFERLLERFPNAFPLLRQPVEYTSESGPLTQGWSTFTTKQDNNPPNKPSNPSPPNQATNVDINTDLSWTGGDPDVGDTVTYDVYFGSVFPLPKLVSNISALSYDPGTFAYGELYRWMIVSRDNHGLSTQGPTWWFRTKWDFGYPPNKPSQPSGQINGIVGKEYVYTTSTTDPEGDMVYYLWDWGDGSNSGWSQAYFSGTTVGVKHMWTAEGSYNLRVKAKDMTEQEGPWSDPLSITMPYSNNKPISSFFE